MTVAASMGLWPLLMAKAVSVKVSTMSGVGTLVDAAAERRERLRALREKREAGSDNVNSESTEPLPKPKFRSYKPQDENLKESVLPDAPVGDVDVEIKDLLDTANSKVVIEELDITNLAPRKPDWDLKRDVAKKLEKLEKRTQKAIAELIWERLKTDQGTNINAIVSLTGSDKK